LLQYLNSQVRYGAAGCQLFSFFIIARFVSLHRPLADDKRNYANYKAALRSLTPDAPMVPHLGAHTSELSVQEQLLQPHIPAPGGGPEHIHFRRYRELIGIVGKLAHMQQRGYGDSLPAFSPVTCNFLSGTIRPFFFSFDEDREAAVARLDTRSRQAEPDDTLVP
jgi:hypothetical protein